MPARLKIDLALVLILRLVSHSFYEVA